MRLIRGAPGSGKTSLVLREFRESLAQGDFRARIVVPTATLVRHYQHDLARDGFIFPPSSVVSLSRFIEEYASPLKAAPDGLVWLILRHVLRNLDLPQFLDVAGTTGMASTVLETISLFENAGCTPNKLMSARKLSPHARAFARIWREVDDQLCARGYSSPGERARAAGVSEGLPKRIWMDGFLHFSPLERQLIRTLSQSSELTITVTDAPAGDEIRRLGLELHASDHLLHGIARQPSTAIVAATSMEREADEIARRIAELNGSGLAFREMAVAIRDARAYLPLLRSTFEGFGIPARFYFSTPLDLHPVAKFAGGLVDCVLGGWEFGAALDALGRHPAIAATPAFDRFDFKVREAMPGRGLETLAALCDADLRNYFAIDSWRGEALLPTDWKDRFESFLEAVYRPAILPEPRDFTSVETQRSHVAGLRSFTEALTRVVEFFGRESGPVRLEDFWQVAKEAIHAASVQVPDDRRNVVHVINVFEARQWDVAALFVCGVNDRDFPKKNPQNLLLPDREIDALLKADIPLRKSTDQDRDERALFESLKSRARQSLVLSYPMHTASGASAASSRLLLELNQPPVPAVTCRPTPAALPPAPGLSGTVGPLVDRHRKVSLSALEDLAQCRFKFFAGRTLNLKTRPDRPHERVQPRANGLILHEALEVWLNEGRHGEFVNAFETAFDKAVEQKHLPPGYRLETERIFLRGVARGVRATDRWTGESQTEVELTLDFPGGITVTGRVDRIDRLNETECIIIDYKSGMVPNVKQMVHSPVKLQGPLYALAARERLNLNPVAMMYIAIREDKAFGWGDIPGADLGLLPIPPRWMEDARDRAIERLESLLGGAVHADPVEPQKCRQCDFEYACRFTREAAKVEIAHGA